MVARKRHLSYLAYNVRIKLACAAVTVAFSGRKGLPPLPPCEEDGNRVADRTVSAPKSIASIDPIVS